MVDSFSKEERSLIMKAVKSRGNKSTELKLVQIFKELGIKGWRRSYKLLGNPDFVFPKEHLAIFADGCFWHGHNCRNIKPKDNADYWRRKLQRNKARDKLVTKMLQQRGWQVIRIWECKIRKHLLHDKLKHICKKNENSA